MVNALIGKKIGMTRVFDESGQSVPVTVLQVGPCAVLQKKESAGVVQVGFDDRKRKNTPGPLLGVFDSAGVTPRRVIRDVELSGEGDCEVGMDLTVEVFDGTASVDVTGWSKGRGFAGVMKRHGFKGGPATHGSKFHRRPGSAGPGTSPGRVIKGRKMPGRMGNERVTNKNLKVVRIDAERNLLLVKGSVAGSNGSYLIVRKALSGRR